MRQVENYWIIKKSTIQTRTILFYIRSTSHLLELTLKTIETLCLRFHEKEIFQYSYRGATEKFQQLKDAQALNMQNFRPILYRKISPPLSPLAILQRALSKGFASI